MRTIRLLSSLLLLVGLTAVFANVKPPVVQTRHIEAVQSALRSETVKHTSKPPNAPHIEETQLKTVPSEPPPVAQPVLTDHEQLMQAAGISQADWPAVDYIVSRESGWCQFKWEGQIGYCPSEYAEVYSPENPYKGYGMCQSTPAIKMNSTASDWATNGVTQLKWCTAYAQSRYGGWWPAYNHWVNVHSW